MLVKKIVFFREPTAAGVSEGEANGWVLTFQI